jgi:hypothetical protein
MKSTYQGFDVSAYEDKLLRATTRYRWPRGANNVRRDHFRYKARKLRSCMQPIAAQYWQIYLYRALMESDAVDRPDLFTITLLDKRWHFGELDWQFARGKIEYEVRRALKGLNYLTLIEFQVFGNHRFLEELPATEIASHRDCGRTIAPHIQGLIWGKGPSRAQRAMFAGGINNAPGVTLKRVTDFAGAVRYMVKPPYQGQLIHPRKSGGYTRYPWDMPLKLHHLLFCNLFDYSYLDLSRSLAVMAGKYWLALNASGASLPPPGSGAALTRSNPSTRLACLGTRCGDAVGRPTAVRSAERQTLLVSSF